MEEHKFVESDKVVVYYPAHPPRTESHVFKQTKAYWHKEGAKCVVGNKDCKGGIEIHHKYIEWADSEAVDWDKVKKLFPEFNWDSFDSNKPELFIDSIFNTIPYCELHHRGPAPYGIHHTPGPIWNVQGVMRDDFKYSD